MFNLQPKEIKREKQLIKDSQGFMKKHKDYLVMICDPESDLMILGYCGYITTARVIDKNGKKMGVVEKLLHSKYAKFKRHTDQFLLFVEGALFKMSEKLFELKKIKELKAENSEEAIKT